MSRVPRPYQERAHDALRAAVSSGKTRPLLVSPTGSGKTYMLTRVAAGAVAKGKRCAWFAHRRELVSQAAESLRSAGLDVGANGTRTHAPVQVASVQSILASGEAPAADIVFLDEAHHYAADEWKRLPDAYPRSLIIGATATPERGDGKPLVLFDHLITVAQPQELVDSGNLVPCETIRPPHALKSNYVAARPIDAYCTHTMGRRAAVFVRTVKLAHETAATFQEKGISTRVVWGEMAEDQRDRALADFATGRARVLVNVNVLTEGWDCPACDVVILARKYASASGFIQAVGRGLRTCEGKTHCTLIDLVGVTFLHGDPLEDRIYSLDGERGIRRAVGPAVRFCKVCGEILDAPGPCPSCQHEAEEPELRVTNDPLVKFARIRRDDSDQRVTRLARWIAEARGKGHKWQSALYRYKGAYGTPAPADEVSRALAQVDGRPWCSTCKSGKCEHVKGVA